MCPSVAGRALDPLAWRAAAVTHGVQRLLRIGRNTADLERTVGFYRGALGFAVIEPAASPPSWTVLPEVEAKPSRCAVLALGAQQLELTEFRDAAPYPRDRASCDLRFQHCAIVVADIDAACRRVMQHGASTITQGGPQRLPPSTGSVSAFKFRDPDGHPLELIHFPQGTGDPAWQSAPVVSQTLGIDHSAISVADVDRSVLFYELLGLHVAARGVNRGVEQQRLDDLADVEVDVVAMHASTRTPHLELLGYRTPRGRSAPPPPVTAVAADRVIWQARDIDVLLDAVVDADFAGAVLATGRQGGATVALLRDPDGHLLLLTDAGA